MGHNFQEELLAEILMILEPLALAGQTREARRGLFRTLGWQLEAIPGLDLDDVDAVFVGAAQAHAALRTLAEDPPETLADLKKLLEASGAVVKAIEALGTLLPAAQAPPGFAQLPLEILNALLVDYLEWRQPKLFALGILLSIIRTESVVEVPGAQESQREATSLQRIDFHRIVELFRAPVETLEAEYLLSNGLTDPAATSERLFPRLLHVLGEFGVEGVYGVTPESGVDFGAFGDAVADRTLTVFKPLRLSQSTSFDARLSVYLDGELGVVLAPSGALQFDMDFPRWQVSLAAALGFSGFAVNSSGVVLPEGTTQLSFRPKLTAIMRPTLEEDEDPDGLTFKIGSSGATRLELGDFRVELDGAFSTTGRDFGFMIFADRGAVVMGSGDGDGFLKKVLPAETRAEFQLGVGWSSRGGLRFQGGGGLQLSVPVSLDLGPVKVDAITVGIASNLGASATQGDGIKFEASANVRATLGPVRATAERVGLEAVLSFPEKGGTLGPVDAQLAFKPPSGLGIKIDAGPVSGGGFISFENGRYAGTLELKIYSVAVKAFGVIDTQMPDGSPGFSFVIVISAEFTAIQLGLGFTLLGVGGLLGINRRLDAKALESAVRDGHLANVLFPTNVIARAPEIIRDLTTLFPAAEDRYVFGPMAKIGWGTPTLIRAEIGVILELPGPILSLLGEVRCALPKEDAALVKLNLSVAGRLDFPGKSFELFAALHDSEIAGYKVKGQMAMRLRWGPQPVFALAVGGFHPAFSPPPGFPALQPMAVDLGKNGNPGITLSGFFAITSNTVQVGGALALRASGAGVTLEATLSVKAIFVFSPFSFEAEIDARVRVSFHGYGLGVRLHGMLSGPSPWRIRGSVCVSVLWWDACLSFDKSFGGGARVDVPTIDPFKGTEKAQGAAEDLPGLEDAIKDPRSWEPVAPAGVLSVVSLAQGAGEVPPFDPMGGLSMRQKVVPLETREKISRFGVAKAESPRIFKLMKATVGESSVDLERGVDLKENFAPAQFFEVETRHKLSAPSFVEQVAGYTFTAHQNDAKTGSVAGQDLTYETIVVDTRQNQPPATGANYDLPEGHMVGMLKRSAGGLFGVARLGDLRYIDPERPDRFGFKTPKYVPADRNTLTGRPDLFAEGNKLEAVLAIEAHVRGKPSDLDTVQVVPDYELFAA